ncbi:MAG: starch-binding protein [Clostridia bacterium]|nr:starch-binding protein [Clostridia bacterium]
MKKHFTKILAYVLMALMLVTIMPSFSLTAGATDTVTEAKWGASAESLTNSGTLAEAIAAAEADSSIKYIQLQSNIENAEYIIASGEFTIDLNGKDVIGSSYIFDIRNSGTKVTFIDTAETDGKVSTTDTNIPAVSVGYGASAVIDGGKFEGGDAVYVRDSSSSATIKGGEFTSIDWRTISNSGTLVIEGGSFTAGSFSAVCAGSSTTIKGGTFTAGSCGTMEYWGGVLDLSEYADPTSISVTNYTSAAVTPSDTTIKLPEGYCFYDSENNAVESLAASTKYTVGAVEPEGGDSGTGGDTATTTTIYFSNTSNWTTVYVYGWSDTSADQCGAWPGSAMTDLGNGYWSYELPADATCVIFNNGTAQTADLTVPTDGKNLYNGTGWSTYTAPEGGDSGSTEGGDTSTTVEAKWGASATSLTNSGTLAEAIAAAEADSSIKYIQLQSNIENAEYNIVSGEFTIDLNGNNVTYSEYVFQIYNIGTKVTFVDSAEVDGKVSTTSAGYSVVLVSSGASLIIEGGTFKGEPAVAVTDSSSSATIKGGVFTTATIDGLRLVANDGTLVIEGGSFTAGSWSVVYTGIWAVKTTVKGGSFTAGSFGTIEYYGGVLDLSEYANPTGISVYSWLSEAVTPSDTTIKLPAGYAFFDGEDATTILKSQNKYTIGAEPETKYTVSYNANGGTGSMASGISYGNHRLPENAFTAPEGKEFKAWLVGETEYAPGDIITVSADTVVTVAWQNIAAKITLEMADSGGEGWFGNTVEVYVGDELVKSFTFGSGAYATLSMDYDATKTYVFKWAKGFAPEECSFVIKVNGVEVFSADSTACEGYADGTTVYTLNPKLELAGASITVGQDLTVNYLVEVLDIEVINVTKLSARFTMNGKTVDVAIGELRADGYYPFAFEGIAPQCMGDSIYAEILLDGKIIATVENYSVKENAQKLLETYPDDAKLVQLVTDMLHYGAAAQTYRNYKTDALVTSGVTGLGTPSADTVAPTATDVELDTSTGIAKFTAAGVRFSNVNMIYVKLNTTENVTLKVNGKDVTLTDTTFYTDAIYATGFDDIYTFELYENGVLVQTLKYSVKSYVYAIKDSSNTAMAVLAKALYAYGISANEYLS